MPWRFRLNWIFRSASDISEVIKEFIFLEMKPIKRFVLKFAEGYRITGGKIIKRSFKLQAIQLKPKNAKVS